MGREVRKVAKNWEHPRYDFCPYTHINHSDSCFWIPVFDESFDHAASDWVAKGRLWVEQGLREEYGNTHPSPIPEDQPRTWLAYAEYEGALDFPEKFRPDWSDEERTHFQYYETVSEGTPLSPPFPTKELLIEFLLENPDRLYGPWTREQAERFVGTSDDTPGSNYLPSMVFAYGQMLDPRDL